MMNSLLRTLAAILAVLAFAAIAASPAQALEWKIEGVKLAANETISGNNTDPATKTAVVFKFEVPAQKLIVECTTVSVTGEINAPEKGSQSFALTKCAPVGIAGCTVEEPINFSTETQLREFSGTVYNVMKNKGGGELLFKLTLKGTCGVLNGTREVKGEICSKTEAKGTELVSYPFAFTRAHQEACEAGGIKSLTWGTLGESANFKGTIWATLTGGNKGKKWGMG